MVYIIVMRSPKDIRSWKLHAVTPVQRETALRISREILRSFGRDVRVGIRWIEGMVSDEIGRAHV